MLRNGHSNEFFIERYRHLASMLAPHYYSSPLEVAIYLSKLLIFIDLLFII